MASRGPGQVPGRASGQGPDQDGRSTVATIIDHALLKPDLTVDEVLAGCALAADLAVASVCCRPVDVARCREALAGSTVAVGTVVGFPHGAHLTATKVVEARAAIDHGAVEVDMVIAIGQLRSGDHRYVRDDVAAVVEAAGDDALVKVILENAYLTDAQKTTACRLAEEAGAAYVKTSTGFAATGASVADVRLMRDAVSPALKVKASGGIRTLAQLRELVTAGADRIGTTSTAAILAELADRPGLVSAG